MSDLAAEGANEEELQATLAGVLKNYDSLAARIRTLEHDIECASTRTTLRLHYPSFRQCKPTTFELVNAIDNFLVSFVLPRSKIESVYEKYGHVSADEFRQMTDGLRDLARSRFIKANKKTNRNGEAGELLLYLLTEWILGAPQLIAKMSLKTSGSMPIHGTDGIHIRYDGDTSRLYLYWGESKLYANVKKAIEEAVDSILKANDPQKSQFELDIVQTHIDSTGLSSDAKIQLLKFLDPFDESFNERHDVSTCLIGFDFDQFAKMEALEADEVEDAFASEASAKLEELSKNVAEELIKNSLQNQVIELFFFPLPSVAEFRSMFQDKIGWKS